MAASRAHSSMVPLAWAEGVEEASLLARPGRTNERIDLRGYGRVRECGEVRERSPRLSRSLVTHPWWIDDGARGPRRKHDHSEGNQEKRVDFGDANRGIEEKYMQKLCEALTREPF